MTYIMSCVWLDYMVKYFQCKKLCGFKSQDKKMRGIFFSPRRQSDPRRASRVRGFSFYYGFVLAFIAGIYFVMSTFPKKGLSH